MKATQKQIEARRNAGLANKTHGMTNTKVWRAWSSMQNRCFNERNKDYPRYGGRGISVAKRWLKFDNFYKDMGQPPENSRKYSIDRIDVNGDYSPKNCRWTTASQQANNKRNNDLITFNGETKTLMQWARHVGLSQDTLWVRIYRLRWSIDKALTKTTKRTHCPNGHKYTNKDTVFASKRRCRKCASAAWERSNRKRVKK